MVHSKSSCSPPIYNIYCGPEGFGVIERAKGIEPSSLAWEAKVIPVYDARTVLKRTIQTYIVTCRAGLWKSFGTVSAWLDPNAGVRSMVERKLTCLFFLGSFRREFDLDPLTPQILRLFPMTSQWGRDRVG